MEVQGRKTKKLKERDYERKMTILDMTILICWIKRLQIQGDDCSSRGCFGSIGAYLVFLIGGFDFDIVIVAYYSQSCVLLL